MKNITSPLQKNVTLITFLTLLLVVLIFSIWMITPYLLALTIGGIVALLSYPIYSKLVAKNVWAKAAAALVTLAIVLLIVGPLSVFVGLAIKQGLEFSRVLAATDKFSIQKIIINISDWPFFELIGVSSAVISEKIYEWLQIASNIGTQYVLTFLNHFPQIAIQFILIIVSCFFFLLDGVQFLSWISNKIPFDEKIRKNVVASVENMAIASIWATFAASAAQSAIMFLGFLILGIPGAILAAGITFVFSWVPLLGSTPIWIASTIYLYTQGSMAKAVVMIIIGLIVGVVDNIIRPLVLRGRINMHPLISLISIFGGIGLFGIAGIFLGPILASVTISLIHAWPAVADRFGLMPLKSNH